MENIITLPSSLALIIWKELKETHNMTHRIGKNGLMDKSFSYQELGLITKLNIKNPNRGNLKGISQLYNLKSLTIDSEGKSEYKKNDDILTIDDGDMSEICKLANLTYLSINNQADISYIFLDKMQNLESLSITNNSKLEEMEGISTQSKLCILNCYGNNNLMQIQGLHECIKQCNKLDTLNLDVLLFPDSINFNTKTGEYDKEASNKLDNSKSESIGTVKWHEALKGLQNTSYKRDSIQISHSQMLQLHNKSCEILTDNVKEFASKRDIILGVEMYLAENVIYDNDSLQGNLRMATHNGIAVGAVGGANGAYNALTLNRCVCEGYTRAMQYLLKLKGIKSRNVKCIGTKDTLNMSTGKEENKYTLYKLPDDGYHSIICIEDEDCLYCDPCWDAGRYQHGDKSLPYALLNKAEISQSHTLSFEERRVGNEHITVPRNAITNSIMENELFKQTRLLNVQSVGQSVGQSIVKEAYKGQIIDDKGER